MKALMIVIQGACDHYLFNLHKEFLKTHSKAVQQSSKTVVIEDKAYCVNCDYTAKSHLQLFTISNYNYYKNNLLRFAFYIYYFTYLYT